MSWEEIELKEISEYRTEKISTTLIETNYISTENMLPEKGGITDSSYPPTSKTVSSFKTNDVLVSNIRPYFKKIWFADFDGGCSNDVIVFKSNDDNLIPKFLYYQLSKDEFFDFMMSGANGTKMPRGNRKAIPKFKLLLPPLHTQRRIADILSAYDNLIENNLKRIKLLEQAAQNIYKEWFVNLRFPGHENTAINEETGLPKGWEIKRSDEVFKINIGKTPPRKESEWFSIEDGYKWVSISDMNKSSVFIQKTKERITDTGVSRFNVKVVPKGTVLLSFKLTIGSVVIATEDMVTNEAIAHFNIDKNTSLSTEYTYCHLSCFPYKTLGSTSSIGQALNSKIVKSIPVLLPQQDLVSLFTKRVKPTFLQLENLITQNQKLKAARDILLPRLMNRTIEI